MNKAHLFLLLVLAAVAAGVVGSTNTRLAAMRAARRPDAADPLQDAPPLMAFTTVVLGGFRGLIADVLWLRASRMQSEGRYFELVQLADWITKLEPHSTQTWGFHAWNMAFNVSIMFSEEDERWRWINNGMRLLRDEGLRYNPGDPKLYFELGWLYQHKVGGHLDRAHLHYKRRWAGEMTGLLGGGRPDFAALSSDRERLERMRKIYGLDPQIMRDVDQRYGPLDWRTAEAHAVYWAYRGKGVAPDGKFLACDRMILQCLAASFAHGKLVTDAAGGGLRPAPNLAILPNLIRAYESARREYSTQAVAAGYARFLQQALLMLHRLGRRDEARQLFQRLHEQFPSDQTAAGFEAFIAAHGRHDQPGIE
jgi:hypothetical protein